MANPNDDGESIDDEDRRPPTVILRGEEKNVVDDPSFALRKCGKLDCYSLLPPAEATTSETSSSDDEKTVLYVPHFLNETISRELVFFCRGRFQGSPIKGNDASSVNTETSHRTSESCTMIPASLYRESPPFLEARRTNSMPELVRHVDVAWEVSEMAAHLLTDEGMDVSLVEPLQVVRYLHPDAHYRVHHDHGGYYGKETEHRPWTVLVFLHPVPTRGGHTHFPNLDLRVIPRAGDAIAWKNVRPTRPSSSQEDDDVVAFVPDADMVHAGEPPLEGQKYALNIWFSEAPDALRRDATSGRRWGTPEKKDEL